MRERIEKLLAWGKRNGIEINSSLFDIEAYEEDIKNGYPVDHVFKEDLRCALGQVGIGFELEQGFGPEEYLPEVIESCFSLIGDSKINDIEVTTEDDWQSANVSLKVNGASESFSIAGVDNSDWIPDNLWTELRSFSNNKLPKVLYALKAGEGVNVIYVSSSEISVLEELV